MGTVIEDIADAPGAGVDTAAPISDCDALVLRDDGGRASVKACRSDALQVLLTHAPPRVAAGVAVFGLGAGAVPLLEAGSPEAVRGKASSTPSLFSKEELHVRLGAMEPASIAKELQTDYESLNQVHGVEASTALKEEVQRLDAWHGSAQAAVNSLERRSALAYLGLSTDADADAVAKSYKQRALAAHPDKGGSEEDFQVLQSMVSRIQDDAQGVEESGKKRNLFQTLAELKNKPPEQNEDLPEETQLRRRRRFLHDKTVELWRRAEDCQSQLTDEPGVRATASRPAIALLRQFVDSFAFELEYLPRTGVAATAAEKLLCKFMRQGLEVLTASALVDAVATVEHVGLHFTSVLLRTAKQAGPCPSLERRCRGLLEALAEVPRTFDDFLATLRERLENQIAAEYRGCQENVPPVDPTSTPDSQMPADAAPSEETVPPVDPTPMPDSQMPADAATSEVPVPEPPTARCVPLSPPVPASGAASEGVKAEEPAFTGSVAVREEVSAEVALFKSRQCPFAAAVAAAAGTTEPVVGSVDAGGTFRQL